MADSPKHHIVATGCMFNLPWESMIHNVPLPANHVRVQLNTAIDTNYALSMPTPDVETVAQAVGSFVAWPGGLLILEHGEDFMILLKFEPEVYGQPSSKYVTNEVLKENSSTWNDQHKCLYLFKNFIVPSGLDDKFKIINPHTFAGHRPDMKKKDLSRDLVDIFISTAATPETLFFAPYCQGALWLHRINQALPCPSCPRQLKKSSDCGYYVMKFIKEIIMHNIDTIPTQYFADTYCIV
ncbi:uncharacterized protein LOC114741680 [Neltuma alba]|uniref:uncharacterized protein LOC114741680 n=1 Tax=Neltuma alba TaxID=207710 RepID=UPI0010A308CB|nr:uncharacterized protein LOC114741680 [Prosopis alba]